jgi:hypothetical protein
VTDASQKELVRLVELDYERTATFINGVTATASTIRGWAVTIWLAIIGVSLNEGRWQLAILAAVVAATFLLIDAYHAWLYGEALDHAVALERLSGRYYESLGRGLDDEDVAVDLAVELQTHRFGVYRNLRQFTFRDILFVKPRVFFRVFYPVLVAVAVVIAGILWSLGGPKSAGCEITHDSTTITIDCGGTKIIDRQGVPPSAGPLATGPAPT